MAAPTRLPIRPPAAAPIRVPANRLPTLPPMALPIAPPATAPSAVPPTSFGPESDEQPARSTPRSANAKKRLATMSPQHAFLTARAARHPNRNDQRRSLGQNSVRSIGRGVAWQGGRPFRRTARHWRRSHGFVKVPPYLDETLKRKTHDVETACRNPSAHWMDAAG